MGALDVTVMNVILLFLMLFPLIHVFYSPRTFGSEKTKWLIGVLFFSWVAYIIYLACTHLVEMDANNDDD